MAEENLALVRKYLQEAFANGNLRAAAEYLADNYIAHVPEGDLHGKEAQIQRWQRGLKAFSLDKFTIHDEFAAGDKVATRWSMTVVHNGDWRGVLPTGQPITMDSISIARIEGRKIAETWRMSDDVQLLRQLGVKALQAVNVDVRGASQTLAYRNRMPRCGARSPRNILG